MKDHEWLRPVDMVVDAEVQRVFDQAHAARIAKQYDPLLFGLGHASRRDDKEYYVLDGQHRVEAAKEAGMGEIPVLFKVYRNLTHADEAALFLKLNANKKSVAALDSFRVSVEAGHPVHCDVKRIVESFGLRVAAYRSEGGISAVVALLNVYEGKVGIKPTNEARTNPLPKGQLLSRTLHILTRAWSKDRDAFDAILVRGVAALLTKHGPSLDGDRLAKALAKSGTAAQAVGGIKGLQTLTRKSPTLAAVDFLDGVYLRGLRGKAPKLK